MSTDKNIVSCPHCGAEVKKNATACPLCGSDEETGWSSNTYLDGLDIPEETTYEDIRRNEFGNGETHGKVRLFVIAVILLAVIVVCFILVLRLP
jgi:hypothetical protein